jgi:opacity protein-like surface antigen
MKNRLLAATFIAVLAGTASAGVAFAQNTPPANPNASTPAVANTQGNNPGAPAAGANSFTEAQAKSRIEGAGYSNVSGLTKDQDGIWRGKASKEGTTFGVAVDYQGNVVAK